MIIVIRWNGRKRHAITLKYLITQKVQRSSSILKYLYCIHLIYLNSIRPNNGKLCFGGILNGILDLVTSWKATQVIDDSSCIQWHVIILSQINFFLIFIMLPRMYKKDGCYQSGGLATLITAQKHNFIIWINMLH